MAVFLRFEYMKLKISFYLFPPWNEARSEKDRAKSGTERLTEYYASGITMKRTPVWAVLF